MKAIIVILLLLSTSVVFGQLRSPEAVFNNYSIVRLSAKDSMRRVSTREFFDIKTSYGSFKFKLFSNDITAPNYKSEYTSSQGIQPLDESKSTFTGSLEDKAVSDVRISITNTVQGYVFNGQEEFFIEPASRFFKFMHPDDVIIYRPTDINDNEAVYCLADQVFSAHRFVTVQPEQERGSIKIVEVATEADTQWATRAGGVAEANAEILGIMNMVDAIYRRDLSLGIKVTYQHAWASTDPYPVTTDSPTVLNAFREYWNSNFPYAQYPRDTAHLYTGKLFNLGLGYVGVVCLSPTFAYALTGNTADAFVRHLITSHEIGHNLNAEHVDNSGACANTIMNPSVSSRSLFFCEQSKTEISTFVQTYGSCLSEEVRQIKPKTLFDYDGDAKADLSVFRAGNWFIQRSSQGFLGVQFGQAGDHITPADFDGDNITDIAVYRNGVWFINRSRLGFFAFQFGSPEDIPQPGDYTGDGVADLVVYRPTAGAWYIYNTVTGQFYGVGFGQFGDKPVGADYDGDGKYDTAVFRPTTQQWYILGSRAGFSVFTFGLPTDRLVPADFDGDLKSDFAVYRNGTWFVQGSKQGFFSFNLGTATDIPVPADYDGDSKADIAVFRPITGQWFRHMSSTSTTTVSVFGQLGDIPTPSQRVK